MAGFFSFFRKKKDNEPVNETLEHKVSAAEEESAEKEPALKEASPSVPEAEVSESTAVSEKEPAAAPASASPGAVKDEAAKLTATKLNEAVPSSTAEEKTAQPESQEVKAASEAVTKETELPEAVASGGSAQGADASAAAETASVKELSPAQDSAVRKQEPASAKTEAVTEPASPAPAAIAEQETSPQETPALDDSAEPDSQEAVSDHASETTETSELQVRGEKESFFRRLKKTRDNLAFGISAFVKGREIDDDLYDDLETALLTADLGVETTEAVIEKLRTEAKLRELHDASLLKKRLGKILTGLLEPCQIPLVPKTEDGTPFVILMVGVNGAGKTTTIGKLARKYLDQGLKVMLAAGDTFRAAAVEQLKEWGERAGVPVIAQETGSDSASVLYDALNAARSRKMDVLICDTAGRLQNKANLMNELQKIVRVMRKIDANVPHEVLLVLDAATGQNAVSQAKLFGEAVGVTGLCLTKLDGTAKGGVIFSLADKYHLPIRYVGIGEKAEDLREFKAEIFVEALIEESK
ncbi:MAG TPA: signal recognition particle-docking protein FtsY [Candidatus Avisuccinivibrio pullicola]|nr:signal recognition particle-docking protein FtsY [Candidatus Avisuccinivibrio pullicola]